MAALVALLLMAGNVAAHGEAPAAAARAHGVPGGPGVVAGAVVNEGGEALPAASVVLRREADGVAVASALVGPSGHFRVSGVPAGRYVVVAAHLGYQDGRAHVVVAQRDTPVDAGIIRLAAAPIGLAALQVEARRSPVMMTAGKSVYTTSSMPVASSGTAADVLRAVPEVDVDVNGQVSLRGSSGVTVQINGRPAPVRGSELGQFLQQFPANRIERIEVVPNPSAKSDAEGTGGIVNIVLKQGADLGLSGSAGVNVGSRVNGGSGRLAYQAGRLTVFGSGAYNVMTREDNSQDLRQNLLTTPLTSLTQVGVADRRQHVGWLDVSSELSLSKRSTLWLAGTGFGFRAREADLTDYLLTDASPDVLQRYDRGLSGHVTGRSTDLSLGLRRVVQPQRDELTVELRDSRWTLGNDSRNTQELFADSGATTPGAMSLNHVHHQLAERSLQVDYTHPLGKATRLEAGARLFSRPVDYDNTLSLYASPGATTPGQVQDGSWRHRATVYALYGTLARTLGRVTAEGGLRAEDATSSFRVPSTGERFDYSYRNLYPSAALAYDLKGGKDVRLSYSRRIDRPYPMFMNPYVPSPDPLNRQVGNPYLHPKYTQSLTMDLSWNLNAGMLRLSPYYRSTVDNWDQVKEADTAGVAWVTWKNLAQVQAYGTTLMGSLRQWGPLSGYLTLGGYREVRDASNLSSGFSGSSLRFTASTNTTLTFNHSLTGQLQVNYQPAHDLPQGHIGALVMSSLGLTQKLDGGRTTLTAAVTDPLNVWRYRFVTRDPTHVQTSVTSTTMRRVSLSVSRVFGKPPQQKAKREQAADPQAAVGGSGPIH